MAKHRIVVAISVIIFIIIVVFFGWAVKSGLFSGMMNTGRSARTSSTPQVSLEEKQLACIDALPDSVKIGQKLMVAAYSEQLGDETPVLIRTNIGGIIVMDTISATQISTYRAAMSTVPFVAVDQEGGTVQRYTVAGDVPGATDMATNFSTNQAYTTYLADDQYLKSIGITTNFSPVVGVMSGTQNPLPGRMYSTDPNVVVAYASASIRAAKAVGITPVIKHFPGLGSATGNTDFSSATTDPLNVLLTRDIVPYKQLVPQQPDVMVGNVIVPGLTDGQPAVWSSAAVKLLRDMGYQKTVVYSDSLTARAIPGTLSDAVVKAWQAGIDVALIVQTKQQTPQLGGDLDEIIAHATAALDSGQLDKKAFSASIERIFNRKGIDACQL